MIELGIEIALMVLVLCTIIFHLSTISMQRDLCDLKNRGCLYK